MFYQILTMSLVSIVMGCHIADQEIGYCTGKSVLSNNSFCGDDVADNICVPKPSVAWSQYSTVQHRDRIIEDIFVYYIQNKLLQEYIYLNATSQVLSNNQNCYDSYKKFICQFNFPPCNLNTQQIFPVCKSYCTNFFVNCMSSSDACDIIFAKKSPGLDSTC